MPRREYALHRLRRHTGRKFECGCGASFYTPKKLEDHKREIHTGPWYRCGRCLVVFKTWKSFVRHTKGPPCRHTNPLYPADPPDSGDTDRVHKRQRPLATTSERTPASGDPEEHRHTPE